LLQWAQAKAQALASGSEPTNPQHIEIFTFKQHPKMQRHTYLARHLIWLAICLLPVLAELDVANRTQAYEMHNPLRQPLLFGQISIIPMA